MQRACRTLWPLSPVGEQDESDAIRGGGRSAPWGKSSVFA